MPDRVGREGSLIRSKAESRAVDVLLSKQGKRYQGLRQEGT